MVATLIDPRDGPEKQNAKLLKIVAALMKRVEQDTNSSGQSYHQFQNAAALEAQVRARTRDLEATLELLNLSNARQLAATREAERARADLANALEAVQEGFALFDPDGNLVMRNSRFCAALPDIRDRLVPGLNFSDYVRIVSESPTLTLPEGMTRAAWAQRRARAHAERHVNFNVQLAGDRWIQVSEQRTPDGGTAMLQTDVTDMIRLERQERDKLLDDQSRLVRATLDHINQGVAIFDASRCLVGWNARLRELAQPPARLLRKGVSFESIAAYFSADRLMADAADPGRLERWVAHGPGRPPLALELRRPGGLILDVFCQEMPDGGFVISLTDVTAEREAIEAMHRVNETLEQRVLERTLELSAARDEAERANASKSRFVAAASHDLLQPLNAAKLFIATLAGTALSPEQQAITGRIQSAFQSVESILGALLDISKLDAGAAVIDRSAFPLDRILVPLAEEFGAIAERKGLGLHIVRSGAWVESDPAYLRRILQNLVSNALRYTARGKVLVGARRAGRGLRIEVHDTGPGIPADKRTEVFKEFRRLDTTPGAPPGMGLGLAIVERACRLLDHDLSLRSIVGQGTCFAVTVPLARGARADRLGPAPPVQAAGIDLTDMIALVIEDDDAVRLGMISVLENWGVSSFEARNVAEAHAAATDMGIAPDVILADLHIGESDDGLDIIAALRGRLGPIPAVLITADRTDMVRRRAASAPAHLLHKPLQPQMLRSILSWIRAAPAAAGTGPEEGAAGYRGG
ncbi:MAG TPA: PAS-domain containing protein [Paracoccaceae bacterium]|nr:PAS-domain containing protein [Paracoccaceae bacterium]